MIEVVSGESDREEIHLEAQETEARAVEARAEARGVIEVVSGESDREEIHLEAQEAEAPVEAQYEIDEKEPDEVEAKVAEPRRGPRDDIHVDHTISGKDLWESLQWRVRISGNLCSGRSRIYSRAPTPGGSNLLFGIIFAENCMEMKLIGLRGGRTSLASP